MSHKHFEYPIFHDQREYNLKIIPGLNRFTVYTFNQQLFVFQICKFFRLSQQAFG